MKKRSRKAPARQVSKPPGPRPSRASARNKSAPATPITGAKRAKVSASASRKPCESASDVPATVSVAGVSVQVKVKGKKYAPATPTGQPKCVKESASVAGPQSSPPSPSATAAAFERAIDTAGTK